MNKNSLRNFNTQWYKILTISWICLLVTIYIIYIKREYSDIFFESQFLHIDFLKDINKNQLTGKGFFTAFGEHVFPGYNFILAANYYLLNLWGGFDSVVYAISLSISVVVIVVKIYRSPIHNSAIKTLIAFPTTFLLLSTTNNPQWGMALAAAVGVTMFVISASLISTIFENDNNRPRLFAYFALLSSIVLFLGGIL